MSYFKAIFLDYKIKNVIIDIVSSEKYLESLLRDSNFFRV